MSRINSEWLLQQFVKERDEATLSMDVDTFRAFYQRWKAKGVYTRPLPDNDYIIEIAIREAVCALANPPADKLKEAKKWLKERGFAEEIA